MTRDALLAAEPLLRVGAFVAVLAAAAASEVLAPRRGAAARAVPRRARWAGNLGLLAASAVVVRLIVPAAAVGAAVAAEARGWGLLNMLPPGVVPGWAAFAATLVILDLALWAQHAASHAVAPLWRLHRVHHADPDMDATTGLRFHPGEVALSMAWKVAVVLALGAPAAAVLVFEVLLNAASVLGHADARLPARLDAALRRLVVTPDVHRVHHSARREERDSNYGFLLIAWDRVFGTYRAAPRDGHAAMRLGVPGVGEGAGGQRLDRLLLQPLAPLSPRVVPASSPAPAAPATE